MIKMILAVDRDNAIGWPSGELPWKISADMKRFKELTTGSTILMGRNTFESLQRPHGLPNRHNIVITNDIELARDSKPQDEPYYFRSRENPLRLFCDVHQACLGCTPPDLWIIGGASIYNQAISMQLVDEIYLTRVNINSGATVKLDFNLYDWAKFTIDQAYIGVKWTLTTIEEHIADDGLVYSFLTLKRMS